MEKFDLAIAYVWEYDKDFVELAEARLQSAGLSTFIITEHNIHEITELVQSKKIGFSLLLDRAWDVDTNFEALGKMLHRRKTYILNPYKAVHHAIDKATMHLEFITAGINTPYSLILPPKSESEEIFISLSDIAILGRPFIIKPCNTTGGGVGVVTGAESLNEILDERHRCGNDKYIIQEKVYPALINGRRAWFRCFWAFGKVISVWWDDLTHEYQLLSQDEIETFGLKKLKSITKKIAEITQLDFFSTEIAYTTKNRFVSIDYVNDQCDMRIQSIHRDGVPDMIIEDIIASLQRFVIHYKHKHQL
ncbi:MAG: hypothetical protein HYV28_19770 [Ignavibacteriales bacterium]|nr:hypothetical protein [Ignavibacteriales bacterium]